MSATTWHAVQTQPRAEWTVHRGLAELGYETLHLHFPDTVRHGRRVIAVLKPHFPRYVFVGVGEGQGLYAVSKMMGVTALVCAGQRPLVVPADVIEELRQRGDATGRMGGPVAEKRRRLQAGEVVRLTAGPFEGFFATVAIDEGVRLRVWLKMFGREAEAVVAPLDVEPASPERRRLGKSR